MAKTSQVLLITTVQASEAWQANRFVNYFGKQTSQGEAVLGVSVYEADQGDTGAVGAIGIISVEAGGQIAAGDPVAAGDQGLAVKFDNTGVIVGRALDSASGIGSSIRILLTGG